MLPIRPVFVDGMPPAWRSRRRIHSSHFDLVVVDVVAVFAVVPAAAAAAAARAAGAGGIWFPVWQKSIASVEMDSHKHYCDPSFAQFDCLFVRID